MLVAPDMWVTFADCYPSPLDEALAMEKAASRPSWRSHGSEREQRARRLSLWHGALLEPLEAGEKQDRLDRIARHPALGGAKMPYFRARLAHRYRHRDVAEARQLISSTLMRSAGTRLTQGPTR